VWGGVVAPPFLELRDIGARHEGLVTRAPQDDDSDVVIGGHVLHVFGHHLPHLQAHRVPLFRLVEDDPADRAVLVQHQLRRFAHGISPGSLLAPNPCIARLLATQAARFSGGVGRRSAGGGSSPPRGRRSLFRGGWAPSGRPAPATTGWERVPLTPTELTAAQPPDY